MTFIVNNEQLQRLWLYNVRVNKVNLYVEGGWMEEQMETVSIEIFVQYRELRPDESSKKDAISSCRC